MARISMTLSRHFSLLFIASGRSSGQHPVSSHSCWMYVRAGRPAFARPCVGVHKSTSLSSLILKNKDDPKHWAGWPLTIGLLVIYLSNNQPFYVFYIHLRSSHALCVRRFNFWRHSKRPRNVREFLVRSSKKFFFQYLIKWIRPTNCIGFNVSRMIFFNYHNEAVNIYSQTFCEILHNLCLDR